jgi:hypothetical protein
MKHGHGTGTIAIAEEIEEIKIKFMDGERLIPRGSSTQRASTEHQV